VNDASKDETLKIIEEYSSNKQIKVIKNEINKGISESRNLAITASKGKYIAFLDSDDLWEKEKLEIQIGFMIKNNYLFTHTGVRYIDVDNNKFPGVILPPNKISYKELLKGNKVSTSSVVLKREIIKNIKMEDDSIGEDFLFWLKILKGNNIESYGIQEILTIYRISKNSASGNKLKSIKRARGVYKKLGISFFKSWKYTISHLLKARKKYKIIYKGVKK